LDMDIDEDLATDDGACQGYPGRYGVVCQTEFTLKCGFDAVGTRRRSAATCRLVTATAAAGK
jgi:hypothetical protein